MELALDALDLSLKKFPALIRIPIASQSVDDMSNNSISTFPAILPNFNENDPSMSLNSLLEILQTFWATFSRATAASTERSLILNKIFDILKSFSMAYEFEFGLQMLFSLLHALSTSLHALWNGVRTGEPI